MKGKRLLKKRLEKLALTAVAKQIASGVLCEHCRQARGNGTRCQKCGFCSCSD